MMRAWSRTLTRDDATSPAGPSLTLEAWVDLPEDVEGELVDGRLTEEEAADPIQELAVTWLIALFTTWLGDRGFIFGSDVKLAIHERKGRKADVAVYLPGANAPPRRGALRLPPDILVEVVSASPRDERRDRVEKMTEYADFGVRYYWIVDPTLGSFEIFELGADGRFARALGGTEGSFADIPGCPGLALDLDKLRAHLDRLAPDEES